MLPTLMLMGDCFFIANIHFAVTLAITADYAVANMALTASVQLWVAVDAFCDSG